MFRMDPVFFHPLIPYLPAGHALALIPIIPGREESDEFRMYEFKVRICPVSRPHDWTECPWAHPGERARRRDPRRVGYKAVPCEEYRASQSCRRGDGCEFAHGVFEYWLHPARYRTRACTAGAGCTRKVCFFAHAPQELRAETRCPLAPVEESMTTAVAREGEVSESMRRLTTRSSEGSNSVECEDDECEMPDVEWIRDLIG